MDHPIPWTLWSSGLRRWLKAPFGKGVGSNPTAVNRACSGCECAHTTDGCCVLLQDRHRAFPKPKVCADRVCAHHRHVWCFAPRCISWVTNRGHARRALGPGVPSTGAVCFSTAEDSLAERSKAVAQGAIPKGCGFELHSCQSCMQWVRVRATDDCCALS